MKETIVKTIYQLEDILLKKLSSSTLYNIKLLRNTAPHRFVDTQLEVHLDNRTVRFYAEYRLNPAAREIEELGRLSRTLDNPLTLVTVRLTGSAVSLCKRAGISCLDLNGRVWIRVKGVLIDKHEHLPGESYCIEETPVDFFSLKSSRLARVLLANPGRSWKQSDLALQTELSQGLLSRLLKYASSQGWVSGEGTRASWRVEEPDAILDAWVASDRWEKRTTIKQFSILEKDLEILGRSLLNSIAGQIAFTQWFAASLRFPYADTQILSAYLQSFPDDGIIEKLHLREVSDGGKVWIIIPSDTGVFQARQNIQGFPLVSDAQIYLDLIKAGLRGPDQARELRRWEGFCK